MSESKATTPEPFVDVDAAAAYLSLSVSTIYQQVAKGEIPHYKKGRTLRFLLSDLAEKMVRVDPST